MNGTAVGDDILCSVCKKLYEFNQFCPICRNFWTAADTTKMCCCAGCDMWVHADCDPICKIHVENPHEKFDYYCEICRQKDPSEVYINES